jgi:fatty acid elongase 3
MAAPLAFTPITLGAPTLDHPFGLSMYPLFERAFAAVMGHLPQDFRFVPAGTPMSTFGATATALIGYYVVVFGGREMMRSREAFKLNGIFMLHNLVLTAISGALLLLFLEQLIPTVVRNGIFYGVCDKKGGWTDHLVILYYLNYVTKYLELLDTVFLFLKKKPLSMNIDLSGKY